MKHATQGKGRTGPGGIKCPCCTRGKPRDVKRNTARHNRRTARKVERLWAGGIVLDSFKPPCYTIAIKGTQPPERKAAMEDEYLDSYMEDMMSGPEYFEPAEDYNAFEDEQVYRDHEGDDFESYEPEPV